MSFRMTLFCATLALFVCAGATSPPAPPHIVLIVADDLGWNDVGFHGLNNIPTPNIDALSASGLTLQNYYVAPLCTPSRAALMTGKYPIHTGMQHKVLLHQEPRGLPLTEKLLPQYLKELGYNTHLIGKWHLGFYKKEYFPMNRGFDSHLGFLTANIDMYDHTTTTSMTGVWGHDFRRNFDVAYDLFDQYATDIYTDRAVEIINSHNASTPLFLEIAHSAVHTGIPSEPIRAPDDLIAQFGHIEDYQRRKHAAVLSKLDESVGKVVSALGDAGLLQNSVILFTTDNGGAPAGLDGGAGSNYPLRGSKFTLWEGGVRGAGVLWSPLLRLKEPRIANQMLHIVDWLPTLLSVAGGNPSELRGLDGIDQWGALSKDTPSKRTTVLHNIDIIDGLSALTVGKWKIINGLSHTQDGRTWDSWYGPSGRQGAYDVDLVFNGPAGQAIAKLGLMTTKEKFIQIRESATVNCNSYSYTAECKPLEAPCLFNILEDPCELRNLAAQHEDIVNQLLNVLSVFNATALPPGNLGPVDRGDPKYWGRVFTNFDDFSIDSNCVSCLSFL